MPATLLRYAPGDAGWAPRVVMEVLGQSQITLTMNTYSYVIPSMQREAAPKLDALLRNGGQIGRQADQ